MTTEENKMTCPDCGKKWHGFHSAGKCPAYFNQASPETGKEWGKRIEFIEVNGKHWLNEEQVRKMLASALAQGEKIGAEKFYQRAQKEANKYLQDTLFPQLKVAVTEILLSTNDALKG